MFVVYLAIFVSLLFSLKHYMVRVNLAFSKSLNYNRQELVGKNAVIVDGDSEIAKSIFLGLAKLGCNVVIGSNNIQKGSQMVIQALIQHKKHRKYAQKQPILQYFYLDINQKKSIEEFTKKIPFQKIDFLVNKGSSQIIIDQKEPQQAFSSSRLRQEHISGHLGYFYLTYLLIQKLQKRQFFRIVNVDVSSKKTKTQEEPLSQSNKQIIQFSNIIFTKSLADKLDSTMGISVAVNPGLIRTQILKESSYMQKFFIYTLYPFYYMFTKSDMQGSQTILYVLIKNPRYIQSGGYYENCKRSKENPKTLNMQAWQGFWQSSEKSLGITFQLL